MTLREQAEAHALTIGPNRRNIQVHADIWMAGHAAGRAEAVKICDDMAEEFSLDGDDDAAAAATIVGGAIDNSN